MFKIAFSKTAVKDFKKISRQYQKALTKSLDLLKTNPSNGKPLIGDLKGYFRIKVSKIRIIYTLNYLKKLIEIKAVGFRKDIYKRR